RLDVALLSDEAVARTARAQQLANRALGVEVRLADEVRRRALAAHAALRAAARSLEQPLAGHACGLDGDREQSRRLSGFSRLAARWLRLVCGHGGTVRSRTDPRSVRRATERGGEWRRKSSSAKAA